MILTFEELKYYLCLEIEKSKKHIIYDVIESQDITFWRGQVLALENTLKFLVNQRDQEIFREHQKKGVKNA